MSPEKFDLRKCIIEPRLMNFKNNCNCRHSAMKDERKNFLRGKKVLLPIIIDTGSINKTD